MGCGARRPACGAGLTCGPPRRRSDSRATDIRLHFGLVSMTLLLTILVGCVSPSLSEPLTTLPDPFKSTPEGMRLKSKFNLNSILNFRQFHIKFKKIYIFTAK